MTLILDLSPGIEQELEANAARDGVAPGDLALRFITSALHQRKSARRHATSKVSPATADHAATESKMATIAKAESLNSERVALIKKQVFFGLSPDEADRLEHLQQAMRAVVNAAHPLPTAPPTE